MESERSKEGSVKSGYTDEDLDELLREEADIIAHPSVNRSKLRGDRGDEADDSDESLEESDDDREEERILGETSVDRMPGTKVDSDQKLGSHVSWCTVAHEDGGDTDRVHCTLCATASALVCFRSTNWCWIKRRNLFSWPVSRR